MFNASTVIKRFNVEIVIVPTAKHYSTAEASGSAGLENGLRMEETVNTGQLLDGSCFSLTKTLHFVKIYIATEA